MSYRVASSGCNLLSRIIFACSAASFSLAEAAESGGWYSKAQATEGETTYNTYCAQCHGPDLDGALGPPLKGEKFLSKWKTGAELYQTTSQTMPPTNPGTVPEDDLIKITAFIFSENGLPGGAELTKGNLGRPLEP
jgi:mono/diheme cytochrome c family protein